MAERNEPENRDRWVALAPLPPEQPEDDPIRLQPRQPRNLEGLLRFAMSATRNEDASGSSGFHEMSEERRKFLEEAMNSISVDITKDLQRSIDILSNKEIIGNLDIEKQVPTEIIEEFFNLEEHVSQIDNAIGFYNIGGFSIFPVCLSSEHPSVRSAACNVIGELCQNNPFCQAKVLECGYLHTLMSMLNTEREPENLSKVMYAISTIIRHCEPGTTAFFKNDGYNLLNKIFKGPHLDLHTKTAFFLSGLYPDNKYLGETLVANGVVRNLILAIPKTYHASCDQILRTLNTLIGEPGVIDELKNPEYDLKDLILKYYNNEYNSGMDYVEEKSYCEAILAVLKNRPPPNRSADVDR